MGPKKVLSSSPVRVRVVSQINGARRLENGTVMYHVSGRRFREGQDDWRHEEELRNHPRFPQMLAEFREQTRGLGIMAEEAADEQVRQEAEALPVQEAPPRGGVALNGPEGPALAPAAAPDGEWCHGFRIPRKIVLAVIALLVVMIAVLLACDISMTDEQFYVSCGHCICNKWTYEFSHWY